MSSATEKYATRVTDTTKNPRERLLALISVKDEGFSAGEVADFVRINAKAIFACYNEFVSSSNSRLRHSRGHGSRRPKHTPGPSPGHTQKVKRGRQRAVCSRP